MSKSIQIQRLEESLRYTNNNRDFDRKVLQTLMSLDERIKKLEAREHERNETTQK